MTFRGLATRERADAELRKGIGTRGGSREARLHRAPYGLFDCDCGRTGLVRLLSSWIRFRAKTCGNRWAHRVDEDEASVERGSYIGVWRATPAEVREFFGPDCRGQCWWYWCQLCKTLQIKFLTRMKSGHTKCICRLIAENHARVTEIAGEHRYFDALHVATPEDLARYPSRWHRKDEAYWLARCKNCGALLVLPRSVIVNELVTGCRCVVRHTARRNAEKLIAEGRLFKRGQRTGRDGPAFVLGARGACPIINGTKKRPLTDSQFDVVSVLPGPNDLGIQVRELISQSGHEDARKILHRLVYADEDWRAVIDLPGKERKGQGYRLRIAPKR
jgi:hypothetical protein